MGVVGKRAQKIGYMEIHRLWCVDAYRDGCPGHANVEVLCKQGELVSMKGTKEHTKCSACNRYLQTMFRYKLVAAIPPDVPILPNPYAGKSGTDIQMLLNRGETVT